MNEIKFANPLRIAAILIILVICFVILAWAEVLIIPLLFAIIFSSMLFPICLRLEKWGWHKGLASFCAVLAAGVLLALFLAVVVIQLLHLIGQAPELIQKMGGLIDKGETYISQHWRIAKSIQADHVHQLLGKVMENSSTYFSSGMTFTANLISQFVLVLLFSFFLLYLRVFFLEFFYKVFASSDKLLIDDTMQKIYEVIQNYLVGLLKVIGIIGALNSVGLWCLGIESPLFFGFLGGILVIIPYIGILIGSALPILVALITKDSYWYAVGVMAVFLFVHILEGNLITPYVVGSKVSINPLVAIFALLLFGKLWGLSGLILALPVTAICKIIFDLLPGFKAVGFLLGKPQKYHFKPYSRLHAKLRSRVTVTEQETTVTTTTTVTTP
ncbi:AI-2E family transporter [Flavitalea sp. BT771]|uniref:AI-2E family transporter n=1 Tax=Flavitalea sp. BT771 TaxID=3063329 RepID=UPI0026E40FA1|nr:AI-2E family transporter [Flavitalea sp. BT771]MDO6430518.1 AI-2E family transporter [Flavitalea sp. BT771]MDV6219342.1 AI-2E family transporter [Flavitalea sp. BT771]